MNPATPHAGPAPIPLEILGILAKLGRAGDERSGEARALVASKADAQGRWKLQSTFNGRFVVDIETRGEPTRWITLRALTALTALEALTPLGAPATLDAPAALQN